MSWKCWVSEGGWEGWEYFLHDYIIIRTLNIHSFIQHWYSSPSPPPYGHHSIISNPNTLSTTRRNLDYGTRTNWNFLLGSSGKSYIHSVFLRSARTDICKKWSSGEMTHAILRWLFSVVRNGHTTGLINFLEHTSGEPLKLSAPDLPQDQGRRWRMIRTKPMLSCHSLVRVQRVFLVDIYVKGGFQGVATRMRWWYGRG